MNVTQLLQRYPVEMELEDETRATIRPLNREDKVALARFFQRVPEEDRFYLKENVTAPEVVQDWIESLDYERVVPLVAIADGSIVADATLHRSRAPARRHVGELRVVVDPEFRSRGLGSRLIRELIELGSGLGLDRLFFELVDRREMHAIHALVLAGFEEVAVLRGRVKDLYGSIQDVVIMEKTLAEDG